MAKFKRTLSQVVDRFWPHMAPPDVDGCRRWLGALDRDGYGQRIRVEGRRVRPHAFAWRLTYHGPTKPGAEDYRHSCDHAWCCEPAHVYPGTNIENVLDMLTRNRNAAGERHYKTTITDAEVGDIRARLVSGVRGSVRQLAAEYGVSDTAISNIKHYRTRAGGEQWRSRS